METQALQFGARLDDQERSYTEQLESALEAAIAMARETERFHTEAQAPPPPPRPRLRILRPEGAQADDRQGQRRHRLRNPPGRKAVRGSGCRSAPP